MYNTSTWNATSILQENIVYVLKKFNFRKAIFVQLTDKHSRNVVILSLWPQTLQKLV